MNSAGKPVLCVLLAVTVPLAGCAVSETTDPIPRAGLGCVDDSPACISQRQATLKTLVQDQNRSWIKEPVNAAAYASGVRLFAFKTKKKELSCTELQQGRQEADGAPSSLRSSGTGLTPAQVSRGVMLAAEVGRELGNEYNRRCKKG
jgi:hypothetical protein